MLTKAFGTCVYMPFGRGFYNASQERSRLVLLAAPETREQWFHRSLTTAVCIKQFKVENSFVLEKSRVGNCIQGRGIHGGKDLDHGRVVSTGLEKSRQSFRGARSSRKKSAWPDEAVVGV